MAYAPLDRSGGSLSIFEQYRGESRKRDVVVDQMVVQRHSVSMSARTLTRNYG
jgi:hypothetical protein